MADTEETQDAEGKNMADTEETQEAEGKNKADTEESQEAEPEFVTSTPRGSTEQTEINIDTIKDISVIEKEDENEFKPTLYSFKIPGLASAGVKNPRVQCPAFHILLDHTIAVLWHLYLPDESRKDLGILHLQWAKCFLESIRDDEGNISPDIDSCIKLMTERILQLYDDISSFIRPDSFDKLNCSRLTVNRLALDSGNADNPDSFKQNLKSVREMHDKNDLSRKMHCTEANYPVSITLKEMFSKNPEFMEKIFQEAVSVKASSKSITDKSSEANISSVNVTVAQAEMAHDCISRVQIIGFLTTWRKEQVLRIQDELKRLHAIEEFMNVVDKNIEPFVDENVIRQIYSYDAGASNSSKDTPKDN